MRFHSDPNLRPADILLPPNHRKLLRRRVEFYGAHYSKGAAMRKQFEDLLDEITEARSNAATSNDTRLEPRVARLEHIVQQMLLALIETT
jgi:hypothetical protein